MSVPWNLLGCENFITQNPLAVPFMLNLPRALEFVSSLPLGSVLPWFASSCIIVSGLHLRHDMYNAIIVPDC